MAKRKSAPRETDVDGFWRDGYTIVRAVYTPAEIDRFRAGALASKGTPNGDLLSNPRLRHALTDGRLVGIARQILGQEEILYAGDSSYTIGRQQHGYHKDNADRVDGDGPDWRSRYTLLRFGIYLQDHTKYTGGLNLRVGSHNAANLTEGENIYVRSGLGDVAVWSLRTSHSGNGTKLSFPWWRDPDPRDEGRLPRWARLAPSPKRERMAIFAALGLDDAHHDRYTDYLKTRTYIVNMWRNSHYDEAALAEAAAIGLKVRDLPAEVADDPNAGQHVLWQAIPY